MMGGFSLSQDELLVSQFMEQQRRAGGPLEFSRRRLMLGLPSLTEARLIASVTSLRGRGIVMARIDPNEVYSLAWLRRVSPMEGEGV